jgi:hypothetical protein
MKVFAIPYCDNPYFSTTQSCCLLCLFQKAIHPPFPFQANRSLIVWRISGHGLISNVLSLQLGEAKLFMLDKIKHTSIAWLLFSSDRRITPDISQQPAQP